MYIGGGGGGGGGGGVGVGIKPFQVLTGFPLKRKGSGFREPRLALKPRPNSNQDCFARSPSRRARNPRVLDFGFWAL